jgi:hypothetical protein
LRIVVAVPEARADAFFRATIWNVMTNSTGRSQVREMTHGCGARPRGHGRIVKAGRLDASGAQDTKLSAFSRTLKRVVMQAIIVQRSR